MSKKRAMKTDSETVAAGAKDAADEGTTPSPEAQLKALEIKAAEAEDRFVRGRAELENYRRRMQRELLDVRQQTKSATVLEFLSVLDPFQMAMDHVEESPDFKTLKTGMDMILSELKRTFENLGLERIDATGQPFDPNIHEAVAQQPSDTVPAETVLQQWKCGFRLGDKLVRPASVIVSSGPEETAANNDDA